MLGRTLLLLLGALVTLACSHVPAYARGRLLHPSMRLEDMATPAEAHVHAVQEGAIGGTIGASSKCGCN